MSGRSEDVGVGSLGHIDDHAEERVWEAELALEAPAMIPEMPNSAIPRHDAILAEEFRARLDGAGHVGVEALAILRVNRREEIDDRSAETGALRRHAKGLSNLGAGCEHPGIDLPGPRAQNAMSVEFWRFHHFSIYN